MGPPTGGAVKSTASTGGYPLEHTPFLAVSGGSGYGAQGYERSVDGHQGGAVRIETVTLLEVIAAAHARHASLVPESAGYLVLGVGQASGGLPLRVEPASVLLSTEGVVSLTGPKEQLADDLCARRLQTILATLLAASQGSGAALHAALNAAETGPPELTALYRVVAKALIPLNRSAAKRALARLARETAKAKSDGLLDLEELVLEEPAESCKEAEASDDGSDEPVAAADVPTESKLAGSGSDEDAQAAAKDDEEDTREAPTPDSSDDDDVPEAGEQDDWEEVDLDIELATPTPSPAVHEATPTFVDPPIAGAAREFGVTVALVEASAAPMSDAAESDDIPIGTSVSADEAEDRDTLLGLGDERPEGPSPDPITVTAGPEDGPQDVQDDLPTADSATDADEAESAPAAEPEPQDDSPAEPEPQDDSPAEPEPQDDSRADHREMRPSATPVIGSCAPPSGPMLAALDSSIDEAIDELDLADDLEDGKAAAQEERSEDRPAPPATPADEGAAPVEAEAALDPLEAEARLVERLMAHVKRERGNARQSWRRAKRAKVKGVVTERVRQRRRDEGQSQTLLERFAASEPDDDAINDAAASLLRLTAIDGTPLPLPMKETVAAAGVAKPEAADEAVDPVDPTAFSEPPMDVTDEVETVSPALALPATEEEAPPELEPPADSSPSLEQVEELAASLDSVIEESPSPSPVTVPNTMLGSSESDSVLPEDTSIPPTFLPEPLRAPRASLFVSATMSTTSAVTAGSSG
jgi:hypothetical protein